MPFVPAPVLLRRLAACALVPLLLAGCEDYGRVTQTGTDTTYRPEEVSYAGDPDQGGLLVLVHGNPTDEPREALLEQVYDALSRAAPARNIALTDVQQAGERGIYRVVFVFDPANQVVDASLCAGRIPPSTVPGEEIRVRAAFCRGAVPVTGALGVIERDLVDFRPERFDLFLRDVGYTLFPNRAGDR